MVSVTSRTEGELTGASLSGSSGDSNRTYTLSYADVLEESISIIIDGRPAMVGSDRDYTYSSNNVTFVQAIYDDSVIQITYLTQPSGTSSVETTNATYATTQELAEFMNIEARIPDISINNVATDRVKETVGTGDDSETIFFLDYPCILANTYTLYYGSAESTTTTLTEDTHYTLNKDLGKITLTSAGVTLLSTNNLFFSLINGIITTARTEL